MSERTVEFPDFKPTAADSRGSIAIAEENGFRFLTSRRWQQVKYVIAMHTLATGERTYRVILGSRRRIVLVTCTDEQALAFFEAWAERDFLGERELVKAQRWLAKRQAKEVESNA